VGRSSPGVYGKAFSLQLSLSEEDAEEIADSEFWEADARLSQEWEGGQLGAACACTAPCDCEEPANDGGEQG